MPIIEKSSFTRSPLYQFNGHLQTICPSVFRKIKHINYRRERLILSDGDFLDLDWLDGNNDQLVILSHGLEGNSDRAYMKGMAQLFHDKGWHVLAWNCRSCSGEMNTKLRMYNHGEIGDIEEVIQHILRQKDYKKIVLIGFSMGGNINSKFLGVKAKNGKYPITCSVAISAPFDLKGSADSLNIPSNRFYKNRFIKMLKEKITIKAKQFPGVIDLENFNRIEKWSDFDNFFSAPLNGYKNAADLYKQGSAKNYAPGIEIPTLLINAQNDPILSPSCSPIEMASKHSYLYLETPKTGGHVGFSMAGQSIPWSEVRTYEFVENYS